MTTESQPSRSVTLSLTREERWTLHHVLLHRIERTETTSETEPPPPEVFQAFEVLDAGDTRFTTAQLEAMQDVLAAYQRRTDWWETERARVERLLCRVTTPL